MDENIIENEVSDDRDGTQVYELGYYLLPTIEEENVAGEVSKLHDLIKENKGIIISEGAPFLRNLAYEISKKVETKNSHFNKAYFGWIKFEVEKSEILNIQTKVENIPNILRS